MVDKSLFKSRNLGMAPRKPDTTGSESARWLIIGGGSLDVLARHWWVLGLRGLFGVGFGFAAILLPGLTLTSLVIVFAIYIIADGLMALLSAVLVGRHDRWIAFLLEGVLDLVAACVMLTWPTLTVVLAVYVIGFWAIFSGVALLVASSRFVVDSWAIAVAAIISIVFGALLLVSPLSGALVIALWLGIYAIIFGLALLWLAWKLRRLAPEAAERLT